MKTEREMFKKAYLNLMSGDSLPFPDAVFDEYVKLRTENGYKLVPVENIESIYKACDIALDINNIDIYKGLAMAIIDDCQAMIGDAE